MDAENRWNWQQDDWPRFRFDTSDLAEREAKFLLHGGLLIGALLHLRDDDKSALTVDLISNEALKTSEIEGEFLNRESVVVIQLDHCCNSLRIVSLSLFISPRFRWRQSASERDDLGLPILKPG